MLYKYILLGIGGVREPVPLEQKYISVNAIRPNVVREKIRNIFGDRFLLCEN